jgi:hypothetical protein
MYNWSKVKSTEQASSESALIAGKPQSPLLRSNGLASGLLRNTNSIGMRTNAPPSLLQVGNSSDKTVHNRLVLNNNNNTPTLQPLRLPTLLRASSDSAVDATPKLPPLVNNTPTTNAPSSSSLSSGWFELWWAILGCYGRYSWLTALRFRQVVTSCRICTLAFLFVSIYCAIMLIC